MNTTSSHDFPNGIASACASAAPALIRTVLTKHEVRENKYSPLREHRIMSRLPQSYRKHTNMFVCSGHAAAVEVVMI
jgi:hypothetical protein